MVFTTQIGLKKKKPVIWNDTTRLEMNMNQGVGVYCKTGLQNQVPGCGGQ